jgi:hypothetical protein
VRHARQPGDAGMAAAMSEKSTPSPTCMSSRTEVARLQQSRTPVHGSVRLGAASKSSTETLSGSLFISQ